MSETPISIRKPPPCLGEHNDYVFKQVLGMSDEEIAELEKEKLIGGDEYICESPF
jgi:crotonobetainyl-CoA:carnitine CoA-transferase CaiB-like acyl-CoA transferase